MDLQIHWHHFSNSFIKLLANQKNSRTKYSQFAIKHLKNMVEKLLTKKTSGVKALIHRMGLRWLLVGWT